MVLPDLTYERPVGAVADVKELEYIAALHRTGEEDGEKVAKPTIKAEDVQAFLMSRYGIHTSKQEVLTLIFEGLVGGDSDNDSIDIVDIVAILIIPYIKYVSEKPPVTPKSPIEPSRNAQFDAINKIDHNYEKIQCLSVDGETMITNVLNIILADVVGDCTPQRLTKEFLREIFATYDELGLLKDDQLLHEMINVASGGDTDCLLDGKTFTRALTNDLELYDLDAENRISTNFEDIFGTLEEESKDSRDTESNDEESLSTTAESGRKVRQVFSLSALDFLAGTFRVKAHYIIVWIALTFAFGAYRGVNSVVVSMCKTGATKFGCNIANSIVGWVVTLAIFVCLGTPFMIILNLGNQVRPTIWEILGGIGGISLFIFYPASQYFEWKLGNILILRHVKDDSGAELIGKTLNLLIGSVLLLSQLWNILFWYTEGKMFKRIPFPGGAVIDESRIKQASKLKTFEMIQHAYDLHTTQLKNESSNHSSLLNFNKMLSDHSTKTIGGFIWCWRQFLSGRLLSEDGIWLPSKLIIAFSSMLFVAISAFIMAFVILTYVATITYTVYDEDSIQLEEDILKCHPTFNPLECSYPKDMMDEYYGVAVCEVGLPKCVDEKMESLTSSLSMALFCSLLNDAYNLNSSLFIPNEDNDFLSGIRADFSPCYKTNSSDTIGPDLIVPKSLVSALSDGSIKSEYCASPVAACARYRNQSTLDNSTTTICILGMHNNVLNNIFVPKFIGQSCKDYNEIDEINDKFDNIIVDSEWTVTKYVYKTIIYLGICFALVYGLLNTFGFIPSIILILLKLRYGKIDLDIVVYRKMLCRTPSLIGAFLWGAAFSYFLFAILISAIVFVIAYKPTQKFVVQILATSIGIGITVILKNIISIRFGTLFAGFYRKKPAAINLINVALESWEFAITIGYVAVRFLKMIIVTFAYIGRFDTPLLSSDANAVRKVFYVDTFPLILRSALLATDAHRHPYIERLGRMYIMKLKHGNNFAKKSGTMWRVLFVVALMPWLRYRYRVSSEKDADEDIVQEMYHGSSSRIITQLKTEIRQLKSSARLSLQKEHSDVPAIERKHDMNYDNSENDQEIECHTITIENESTGKENMSEVNDDVNHDNISDDERI